MAAQFFSALADNAILILAINILRNIGAADELEPLLKFFFSISYVALAAFVGAFADSMPKWRVMFISNTVKIGGCLLLLVGVHPLLAYAVIGLGAAAYSPAKYGILTEYLPHRKLVVANGWIEGLTVGAIILGTVLGGELTSQAVLDKLAALFPFLPGDGAYTGILSIAVLYVLAAIFNLYIPDTGVDHKPLRGNPLYLVHDFLHCLKLLWRDKLGQISLAATTLVWGVAGMLQVLVLKWAEYNLDLKELSEQTRMVGVVALGMAVGAVLASSLVSLRMSVKVLPVGILMGLAFFCMPFVTHYTVAVVMLIIIGACGGFFVVPMNALLQHRGHVLMGAGHSISVQNFNENLSILLMNALYAFLIFVHLPINSILIFFGLLVAVMMYVIKAWHAANQEHHNVMEQIKDFH